MFGGADDADDLARRFLSALADLHALPIGFLLGKYFLREGVVDQDNRLRILVVARVKAVRF